MIRRLDDDFMRTNAVHLVEHALGLAIEIAFDAQGGKFVRNHAHSPTGSIPLWWRPAVQVRAIRLDFRGSLAFVAGAKGTESSLDPHSFAHKIRGPLGSIRGDNNPTSDDRVFPEFRQLLNPFNNGDTNSLFYDTAKAFLNNSIFDPVLALW